MATNGNNGGSARGLAGVSRTRRQMPMRILLHGVHGVGKTTFAAHAPAPIFLCPEDGIPQSLGDVAHFTAPENGWTWQDVLDSVRALSTSDHEYKTLVLDTLDWLEPLLWKHVCESAKVASIEEVGGGYGKGYTAATDGWRVLLAAIERARSLKGMNVVLLAHSMIKAFKDPTSESYDRFELKIHKQASGLWQEWVDAVLFARYEDVVTKDARTKRIRGVSTGARVVYTNHHAAYDAKNRYDLPEELPLSWDEFAEAVQARSPADPRALAAVLEENIKRITDKEKLKRATDAVARAAGDGAKLAKLNDWVNGILRAAQTATEEVAS